MPKFLCLVSMLLVLYATASTAQGISGYIQDEHNNPIPYASVFIKELQTGTSSDAEGRFFINGIGIGLYHVIFSSVGYKTASYEITIKDRNVVQKNVWLETSKQELEEVVVRAKRKDPAYEIIQKVIEHKKKHLKQLNSSRSKVYVKAYEIVDVKKKVEGKQEIVSLEGQSDDPFEQEREEGKKKTPNINLLEMNLTLNYKYPFRYKEERTAVKSYGTKAGLYVPPFDQADFNFYRNLLEVKSLTESPVISPISKMSILSYKFKLEQVDTVDQQLVYKIKVTPRKSGNSTCSGYLYINDSIWNINKLDLSFHKGSLKLYDKFRIQQAYQPVADSLWIPYRQEFSYETKNGRRKVFRGNTVYHFSDFQINYQFPEKFFGNEVAITKQEAYKKDSSYWNSTRPEPLTVKEQEMIHHRDSIHAAHNTIEYKDSIEARYNKITLGELLFHGVGYRNYRKQRQYYFGSLTNLIGFEVIGGFRLGPYTSYWKRWESGRSIWTGGSLNIGLKNSDIQGNIQSRFLYAPMKVGSISVSGGRSFFSINPNDAYLNQLRRSNYILNDRFGVSHRREFFNGFYLVTGFNFARRLSASSFNSDTFIGDIIDDKEPLDFQDYSALTTELRISYTPKQRFMTEPKWKVVLGSKYPTFSLSHFKGWSGPFSSDVDFDQLEFSVNQKLTLGMLGNSEYKAKAGKFINTHTLRLIDQKRFRQSDPYLYSNPLESFQLLDTALVATNPYFEVHHIHHFNGALINNIPLVKKLRFGVVAGAGTLWVQESNYRHSEIFVGMERVFKFGARRRLRIGVYGVAAQSNNSSLKTDFKISFDLIDTWKRDWSY